MRSLMVHWHWGIILSLLILALSTIPPAKASIDYGSSPVLDGSTYLASGINYGIAITGVSTGFPNALIIVVVYESSSGKPSNVTDTAKLNWLLRLRQGIMDEYYALSPGILTNDQIKINWSSLLSGNEVGKAYAIKGASPGQPFDPRQIVTGTDLIMSGANCVNNTPANLALSVVGSSGEIAIGNFVENSVLQLVPGTGFTQIGSNNINVGAEYQVMSSGSLVVQGTYGLSGQCNGQHVYLIAEIVCGAVCAGLGGPAPATGFFRGSGSRGNSSTTPDSGQPSPILHSISQRDNPSQFHPVSTGKIEEEEGQVHGYLICLDEEQNQPVQTDSETSY